MTLEHARTAVTATLGRMNAAYTRPVFDEWVLVSIRPERSSILAYHGPRAESFKKSFNGDIQPLRVELAQQKLTVGDFAFAADGVGPKHDACMRVGGADYLFCNHTGKSMTEIRQDPLWREAQRPFVELSDKFRSDPLE